MIPAKITGIRALVIRLKYFFKSIYVYLTISSKYLKKVEMTRYERAELYYIIMTDDIHPHFTINDFSEDLK